MEVVLRNANPLAEQEQAFLAGQMGRQDSGIHRGTKNGPQSCLVHNGGVDDRGRVGDLGVTKV